MKKSKRVPKRILRRAKKVVKKLRQTPLRLAQREIEVLKGENKALQERLVHETRRADESYKQMLAKSHEGARATSLGNKLAEEINFMRGVLANLAIAIKGRMS